MWGEVRKCRTEACSGPEKKVAGYIDRMNRTYLKVLGFLFVQLALLWWLQQAFL